MSKKDRDIKKTNKKNIKKYFKKRVDTKGSNFLRTIFFFLLFFAIGSILALMVLYSKLFLDLPDVKDLKNIKIAEASTIYDRHWNKLYRVYDENRIYVDLEYINKNMLNAIVAWEDKRFWDNPWFDIIWITRSVVEWLKNGNHFSGTSGITQQLAKIMYLSNQRSVERKVKELYLSIQLNSSFDKKDILELYLNKIFFWGNSYWVEQASKSFYWKKAINLNILESSILASLPKAPTWLSPYSHKWKLLGYPLIYGKDDILNKKQILSQPDFLDSIDQVNALKIFINDLRLYHNEDDISICKINDKYFYSEKFIISNWCVDLKFTDMLSFLNSIHIVWDKNIVEYKTGRKDYILWRMLEDWYINFDEYKEAIIWSFWFEFKRYKDNIKNPYFVMYVKDYLAKKYWEDMLRRWGLRIYTSLNPILQSKAEEIVRKRSGQNRRKFTATNWALISLDSKTSAILAMVWWLDYYNKEILGYNNMTTARIQPGSTFKPFVYALAMVRNNYNAGTILGDFRTVFPWNYIPHNADWRYMWRMTLSRALNFSRNVTAVKMYYAAWMEDEIIKKLTYFWMHSLAEFKAEYKDKYWKDYNYSSPMALWTAQISALELAWAYTVFANNWIKNEVSPILKIVNSKWKVIEDNTIGLIWTRVLSQSVAYRMNYILSNSRDRPGSRNKFLTIPWRKIAAKTWTSTKQYRSSKRSRDSKWRLYRRRIVVAKNLWTIGYTPQITTVVWVWNTSWKALNSKAYGLYGAGPIMRDYMIFAHKWMAVEDWKLPE